MRGVECGCKAHRDYAMARDVCARQWSLAGKVTYREAHHLAQCLAVIDRKCPNA